MTEEVDDRTPSEAFEDGIRYLKEKINLRLRALKRGLQQEIDRCKENNDAVDLARAYVRFREIWAEDEDSIQAEMKEVSALFSQLAEVHYPETLERNGLVNVPLADVGRTVGVQVRTKASVAAGSKEEAIAFLRADQEALSALAGDGGFDSRVLHDALVLGGRKEMAKELEDLKFNPTLQQRRSMSERIAETTEGLEAIVVDHIFPQTLSSLAKDWAEEGKELPEDIFKTYLHTTTTWRKLTPKK